MFTGLVEQKGLIKSFTKNTDGFLMTISHDHSFNVEINDSVSCSGVCLTVIEKTLETFTVQLVNETMQRTNASDWNEGNLLNLERALLPSTRMGGHFVQGHIDGLVKVLNIQFFDKSSTWTFEMTSNINKYIVEKGSICLDGISLTIAKSNKNNFKIALIPHTLEVTNWKYIEIGDMVNVEIDMMAKYIKNFMDLRK